MCIHPRKSWRWPMAFIGLLFFLVVGVVSSTQSAQAQALHRSVGPEPDALDIHLGQTLSAINVLRDLHEGLLTFDAQANVINGVAIDVVVDEGQTRWRFVLNPKARWSDGSPIVAQDFVLGWRRALDPATASPLASLLDPIVNATAIRNGEVGVEALGVVARDDYTLEVTLNQPTPWFQELLTHPVMAPWPGEADRFSGAYQLAERLPGAHLRLIKNPHYHQAQQVALETVYWHVIEQPNIELTRFRANQLHITETIPPGRVAWLREQMGSELRIAPYLGTFFLAFNVAKPPFKDQRDLRKALSLVIDRDRLTRQVLGAGETPAYALVPPSLPGWTPPKAFTQAPLEARLVLARALYEEAGFSENKPLTVELRFNTSLNHRRMAAAVGAMWKQALGVQTRLVNEEWKVFVANRRQGRITEVVRGGWIGDWQDPANFLQLFVSDSPLNYTFWEDQTFDEWMHQADQQTDDQRMQTLARAEARLMDQHVIIPLYYYVSRHLVKANVMGYEDNLMDIHLSRWLALQ